MKKKEIFSSIMSEIANATDIDPAEMVSRSRKEEVVEARMMLVYCCSRRGLRPAQIATLLGHTPHNIYRCLRSVADRYRYSTSFRYDCDFVCKNLGINIDL